MSEKFNGEEKRLYPRIPICAQVRIRGLEEEFRYHYTRDLSANGVFLISEEPLPVGTELEIDISIPFIKDLIVVTGQVVRIDDYKEKETCRHLKGFAVNFVRITDKDREFLSNIADNLSGGFREM
ncbi:PilZ domain-containing protein [Acidobacteriota bacterium]